MANAKRLTGILAALLFVFACTPAFSQDNPDPRTLVSKMVNNELHSQKGPHYWIYTDSNTKGGKVVVTRVVQTRECWFKWPISTNGHPASTQDEDKARQRNQQLVSDPAVRSQNRKQIDEDAHKANALMKILPDAFLFTSDGEQDGSIRLKFKPNPKYSPSTNEAKVFHHMAGVLLIDSKETRLHGIDGKLISSVKFGFGILGNIHKGGTFSVEQSEVEPNDWEVTKLDVHISGKALFFHTISEQQHEIESNFKPVPADISLKEAAELAEHGETKGK
jgi:hypothetical protein